MRTLTSLPLTDRQQQQILRAYEECGGIAADVARRLNIRPSAVRQAIHVCKVKGILPRLEAEQNANSNGDERSDRVNAAGSG